MDVLEVHESRFAAFFPGEPWLERLCADCRWAEGPCWFPEGAYLLWSDIPNNQILRWDESSAVTVFRADSGKANGNTRDRDGRLLTCEHQNRRVTRTEPNGRPIVLAAEYRGRRLNSPNDLVVKSDGTVWFTDPDYGLHPKSGSPPGDKELDGNYVFWLEPETGRLEVVVDDFDKPNGLAFSPDESLIYVADSGRSERPDGPHHVRVFQVEGGRRLARGRVFAEIEPGVPDGLRVDGQGNVWCSAADGVHCFSPQGHLLGKVRVPETVSNLAFGRGAETPRLFITATTSLYAIAAR